VAHFAPEYSNAGETNEGAKIYGSLAIAIGNVWLTGKVEKIAMADKTGFFQKRKDRKLKIIVHKFALPFSTPTK